ncbi:MAG: alpha/beta hydrolase [Nocardioides sp.]
MNNEHEVQIRTPDGITLSGDLGLPTQARPSQAIIMCHGISSHRAEYLDMFPVLAERLMNQGAATLRFDFRGHGASSGRQRDFSVASQLVDLRSSVRFMRERLGDVSLRFIGVSFGAAPGIILDATRPTFSRLALFAPVISYIDTFLQPSTDWGKKNFTAKSFSRADQEGVLLLDGEFELGVSLLEELHSVRPEMFVSAVADRTLLVHGTNDSLVPLDSARRLSRDIPQLQVEFVEAMDHGLYVTGDPEGESEASRRIQSAIYDQIVRHVLA